MQARAIHRVGVVAAATVAAFGVLAGSAFAENEDPDLKATIDEPAAVAPGSTGKVHYTVTNVSDQATEGILLNVSLPPHVGLTLDDRCQETGTNDEGGKLISCNFADAERGQLEPGETYEVNTPFSVSSDAPEGKDLGELGALVVPLKNGEPTEDWHDLEGHNVVWTTISTTEGGGGGWAALMNMFS